ncbi:MAG: N-acetylmuramoyl-L-alanine amidase [Anaerolineales bacterium]|nr:N-acetylmuramoyl-L-alanine amidase [Chloroflexota bacterium]MBL6983208.1 N-acetylmuramoyl-L-alanine amidase [Anaerolineales bacterium]
MKNPNSSPKRGPNLVAESLKSIFTVTLVAFAIASLFTAAKPIGIFSGEFSEIFSKAIKAQETPAEHWPTATPRPKPTIGIVVGHWGDDRDPGAVCPDGLTELSINQEVAALLQQKLINEGFDVDLLHEFDDRLEGYQSMALVSIHSDSCTYINDVATGFKVAESRHNPRPERTARMVSCLRNRYAKATGLGEHLSITADMAEYHAFDEINEETPAVIIEIGFMNLDRQLLTQDQSAIASGIANGILCYARNESITTDQ